MSGDEPIKVVLCWHMHQPLYKDPASGQYRLPWTYLHAIKDYVDMAAHLEEVPKARAVVNFTPTLLEQIEDYADAVRRYLDDGAPMPDPLLSALAAETLPESNGERVALVRACLRANEKRLIHRFPWYAHLVELGNWVDEHPDHSEYVSDQFLFDLLMWYHLAWLGETVRRCDPTVEEWIQQGRDFSVEQRRQLLAVMGSLLAGVIERYRRLAQDGRVELSVTPYAHPIMPLLLDLGSGREAVPNLTLPEAEHYPGGERRARWHIEEALSVFERHFGFRPRGCWPAEGGVSAPTLNVMQEYGFQWAGTGEQVLRNSLERFPHAKDSHDILFHRPYCLEGGDIACFFRDDGLSDLIGFSYSDWHADDAVANLIHHIEHIGEACKGYPDTVVSIILDGENAWEHYPENGYYFLDTLYRHMVEHPRIRLTTFSECLENGAECNMLPGLVTGSWVYGTLTTWIGHSDKNRAWDMLVEAKRAFDDVAASGGLTDEQRRQAEHQLAICEGSDWFWWFGDENPADTVRDFDSLYRLQLTRLYALLGRDAPEYLATPFTHGGGAPAQGGVMRPGTQAAGWQG